MFNFNQNKNKGNDKSNEKEPNNIRAESNANKSNINTKPKEVLKVASTTNPNSLAGAIANSIREEGQVELKAIGAGAIHQGFKAIAIARGCSSQWN